MVISTCGCGLFVVAKTALHVSLSHNSCDSETAAGVQCHFGCDGANSLSMIMDNSESVLHAMHQLLDCNAFDDI